EVGDPEACGGGVGEIGGGLSVVVEVVQGGGQVWPGGVGFDLAHRYPQGGGGGGRVGAQVLQRDGQPGRCDAGVERGQGPGGGQGVVGVEAQAPVAGIAQQARVAFGVGAGGGRQW